MKRLLLAPLIFTFLSPVHAGETCRFSSEYEPDLVIEVSTEYVSHTKGFIQFRGSPVFQFETGVSNGYGSQYFSVRPISSSSIEKEERIAWGEVVTVVGNQPGRRGIPKEKRKKGQLKLFFPGLGAGYYYSLAGDSSKPDGRFAGRTQEINTILRAAEGFWIPLETCRKYVYYGW